MTTSNDNADAILTAELLTSTVYISLWRTEPLRDESGTEESGTDYARVAVLAADWTVIGDGPNGGRSVSNDNNIDFGTVGAGGWGSTVGWAGIHTAATAAGNMLRYYPFTNGAVDLSAAGTPFYIPAGDFVVEL